MSTPTTNQQQQQPSEIVFLYASRRLPGITEGEEFDYYGPNESNRLRYEVTELVERSLEQFSENSHLAEYFAVADYGGPDEWLEEGEEDVFRSGLDEGRRDKELQELCQEEVFQGYHRVIGHRLATGALAKMQAAIDLFNFLMEAALMQVDSGDPFCQIHLEMAPDFARRLLDRIDCAIQAKPADRVRFCPTEPVGAAFEPLVPLLSMLRRQINLSGWPRTDLQLGKFLLVADYFRWVLAESKSEA